MSEFIEKAWGGEYVMVNEPEYCYKELVIAAGRQCSLHYHNVKKETFIVKSGWVGLQQGDAHFMLGPGDQVTLTPGTPHRFSSRDGAVITEVSTHHDDADVVRLEPSGPLTP